jgi:hypothetical protein
MNTSFTEEEDNTFNTEENITKRPTLRPRLNTIASTRTNKTRTTGNLSLLTTEPNNNSGSVWRVINKNKNKNKSKKNKRNNRKIINNRGNYGGTSLNGVSNIYNYPVRNTGRLRGRPVSSMFSNRSFTQDRIKYAPYTITRRTYGNMPGKIMRGKRVNVNMPFEME